MVAAEYILVAVVLGGIAGWLLAKKYVRNTQIMVIAAIIFLLLSAIAIVTNSEDMAEKFGDFAYFMLITGVMILIIHPLVKHFREK